ncbi:MAG: ferric reductase-like transmembrane domain-containing protein [Pseudonocardia sp.]|nr:ferric reductase-like transmembrane domain-containing protein [Pseudonocardia sp.]
MQPRQARTLWAGGFVAALLGPVLLSLVNGDDNPLSGQLAVQSGVLATGVMVCAVIAPSRLRSLTRALGIDGVLGVHRSLGLLVSLLVIAHIVLVLAANPSAVTLFDPRQWSLPSRAGITAAVSLIVLVGLALLRQRVGRRYGLWRWTHLGLALVTLLATALHIWWLRHLVNDPVSRLSFGFLAAALVTVLSYRWLWRPFFDRHDAYQVVEVRAETEDVHTLVIGPRRSRHGFCEGAMRFEPGQFAWLRVRRSVMAEEHPFTITSSARNSDSMAFTIRNVGDFTSAIAGLHPGDSIWVDGPHGAFTCDERVRTRVLVLIAAGVGITPMMSMLRTLAHRDDRRPVLLISAAREVTDLLFRDELAELSAQLNLTVAEVLSSPPLKWCGRAGRIDRELLAELLPERSGRRKVEYFVCGPPAMVNSVTVALDELGVDPARVHTEQFDMV